ncbi:MAG: Zn-ribbon domain-containing OB-fold protein [Candidatus Bathyarchaeia archaeon]
MGTRCVGCGKVYCPPRAVCSECLSDEVEWLELGGRGEVVTFTIISVPSAGFEEFAPYTVAIVRLDDGPQLMGMLVGIPPEEVKVGMRVETVYGMISGDRFVYRFRPTAI